MKIGSIRGIALKLHYTTLLIAALVGYGAATFYNAIVGGVGPWTDLLIVGAASGGIILFSIMLHEVMHSLVAQRYGLVISEIELYLFGGVSKLQGEPKTPGQEAKIAIAGPLTSLGLAGAFIGVLLLAESWPAVLFGILFYAGFSNLVLGLFNLLPAFPMDGGRILRAALWRRRKDVISATRAASRVGVAIAYGMMGYGLLQIFLFGLFGGFWLILLGSFLNNAARQSYTQLVVSESLGQVAASQLVSRARPTLSYYLAVADAIREYFVPYGLDYFPVEYEGKLVGILSADQVSAIPVARRSTISVGQAMRPIAEFPVVSGEASGKSLLEALSGRDSTSRLALVRREEDGKILGFVGEAEIQSSLRFLMPQRQQPDWQPLAASG